MNIRVNYSLRTIPLFFYGILLFFSSFISFDFWTPMIDLTHNLPSWFIAGIFNVLLILILIYIRLMIIRFSFQDLNEKIPHSDTWELIQFYVTILAVILVIINGLFLSVFIYNDQTFQNVQIGLLVIPFLIDVLFHLKWIAI